MRDLNPYICYLQVPAYVMQRHMKDDAIQSYTTGQEKNMIRFEKSSYFCYIKI